MILESNMYLWKIKLGVELSFMAIDKQSGLHKIIDVIRKEAGIKGCVIYTEDNAIGYDGSAVWWFKSIPILGVVTFSEELIKKANVSIKNGTIDNIVNVLKFMVGHELAHLKFKDQKVIKRSNSDKAINIIKELRADIVGHNFAKLTKVQMIQIHDDIESSIPSKVKAEI